jgi:hypothetical protein
MAARTRIRLYVEAAVAGAAALAGVVTIFWRDWIEALTGWDPDRHSGAAEWVIVAGLLTLAAVLGGVARAEWRRAVRSRMAPQT